MIARSSTVILLFLLAAIAPAAQQNPPNPVFRSQATAVSLDVSVKRGNQPVTGLTAADFQVSDNGVPQIVEHAFTDIVPIDVTLVIDATGSTASVFDNIRRDAQRIVGLLRPNDRARVIVIDTTPYELLPLQTVGRGIVLTQERRLGVSSIHDAMLAGLVTRPDPDRRRLLVAITDGVDNKSITSHRALERVARRTDTVLHIVSVVAEPIYVPPDSASTRTPRGFMRDEPSREERDLFEALPALTGGVFHGPSHDSRFGNNINVVNRIREVFEEFRQSYVIQYRPRDVTTGTWHDVVVRVKGVDAKGVRARAGYFDSIR